jgi:hypothetical protein
MTPFCRCTKTGPGKAIPTKCYTFSLFQSAEGGLADASGATFGPNDTKLITEKLLPASSSAEQKEAQDLLQEIGIALGGLGVLLGAVAVAVACTAAAASRKGTPTMSAIQMSGGARNGGDPMPTDAV